MIPVLQQPETWLVAIPALGAATTFAFREQGRRGVVSFVLAGIAISTAMTFAKLLLRGPYSHSIGGWVAPLGITWQIDGLAAAMILLTSLVGVMISRYALEYFGSSAEEQRQAAYFWPLWFFLLSGLYAIFLTADIFNWYVTLELSGLAAVGLITLSEKPQALTGSMRYLLIALCASLFYLLGVVFLYGEYGSLDLTTLAARIQPGSVTQVALALMTIGLIAKAALFPLHFWLPPAHANAPSPVSAALSALVVKAGFYILLRLQLVLWPVVSTRYLAIGLGALGAAAILWGSAQAIRQSRLKLLIAYSTVAQIGYLFIMFPLLHAGWAGDPLWASYAWAGGVYQALSHGLAKAALFLAAGVVIHAVGDDRLDSLRGLGEKLPLTATAMALAGISLMGIPPGAGFIAKWLLLSASVASGQWGWAVVMILGGLMAVGYLFRVYRRLLTARDVPVLHQPPRRMEAVALTLAILSLVFGLSSYPLFYLLRIGAPASVGLYLEGLP
ncbi:MAG TPA: proton-conducting transporter membrane subunit [Kiritimatiellia bacterium]|nr:proton-conducting transporter membrane subunit [Kiritimatiellia bacterium]HMO99268.1 proton-conducting transporter membrane subunit [Kiritimatiellia bacterium]HMP97697.1 proton-conducting transporter membrane subunit [Kiritimatiellia bacterium]